MDPLSVGPRPTAPIVVQQVMVPPPEPPKEEGKKLVVGIQGPWGAIRGEFIKVYDTRRERLDEFVANPFGSAGLRRENEMKEKYDSRVKEDEKKDESISVMK